LSYILTIPYTEIPIPANGNLPARITYSPMVKTSIEANNQILNFSFFSVIDSGADHCVFPATFAERLGINVESGIHMPAHGVGGGDNWYFHNIKTWVEIEGQAWHWECLAAFSRGTDNLGIGLLGRLGFFELFEEVSFDQRNRIVKLKVSGNRPQNQPPPST